MSELLQWTAAIVVLAAFGLCQWGVWPAGSYRYLVCNLVGGLGLSAAAFLSHQWGFVLLEAVWGLVAGRTILARLAGRDVRLPSA
ncbi:MAG TPA: hypothetical protein VKR21_11715 [Solirubrobacteraceae bacterium]|nr:hypothetical protein [Solirubrobacteraceae bacterium]